MEETRREDRFGQIDTYRELVKESLLADLVFCREPVRARVFVMLLSRVNYVFVRVYMCARVCVYVCTRERENMYFDI